MNLLHSYYMSLTSTEDPYWCFLFERYWK